MSHSTAKSQIWEGAIAWVAHDFRVYRVTYLLVDLGWVDFDLDIPQAVRLYCSCGAAQARQWNIPNPSLPNQVREEKGHPVY